MINRVTADMRTDPGRRLEDRLELGVEPHSLDVARGRKDGDQLARERVTIRVACQIHLPTLQECLGQDAIKACAKVCSLYVLLIDFCRPKWMQRKPLISVK